MEALERLKQERDELAKYIESLEADLARGNISRDDYLRARQTNETRLIEVLDALVLGQEA
jgi:hypothetical protein